MTNPSIAADTLPVERDHLVEIAHYCLRSALARDGLIPAPSVVEDFVDKFLPAAGFVPAPLEVA